MSLLVLLDTTELIIPVLEANIKDWGIFRRAGTGSYLLTSAETDYERRKPFTKLTLNPKVSDREKGIHLPLVNLIKRNGYWFVQPDGSMPRFFFGTNLFEFESNELDAVVDKYRDFLADNGIFVSRENILEAEVKKADIAKTFLLRPDVPASSFFEVIRKIDYDPRHEIHDKDYYDNEHRDIREGGKGQGVTWGTKKKKIASCYLSSENIMALATPTTVEKELATFFKENAGRIYQPIKLEEALFEKKRVRARLNKLVGQDKKFYTLTDLWDKELTKKVLIDRGKRLFHGADLNTLLLGGMSAIEIKNHLRVKYPSINTKRIANIGYWAKFAREAGFKQINKELASDYSRTTRYSVMKEVKSIAEDIKELPMKEVYDDLFKQLNELKPIRSKEDLLAPEGLTYKTNPNPAPIENNEKQWTLF